MSVSAERGESEEDSRWFSWLGAVSGVVASLAAGCAFQTDDPMTSEKRSANDIDYHQCSLVPTSRAHLKSDSRFVDADWTDAFADIHMFEEDLNGDDRADYLVFPGARPIHDSREAVVFLSNPPEPLFELSTFYTNHYSGRAEMYIPVGGGCPRFAGSLGSVLSVKPTEDGTSHLRVRDLRVETNHSQTQKRVTIFRWSPTFGYEGGETALCRTDDTEPSDEGLCAGARHE